MAKDIEFTFDCPECGKPVLVQAPAMDPVQMAPDVRSRLRPKGNIFVYTISSDDIRSFIVAKAQAMVPGVKVEVVPRYCEGKRRKKFEPHRSYASLRIAFSDDILEKKNGDAGWFGRIGQTAGNIRIVESLFKGIIQRYQYNPKMIQDLLDSYKRLEEVEEVLGMDERYIADLKMYSVPQRVAAANKESWIIFSAAAENVIQDMLTDPDTNKVIGRIQIQDVYRVSKDVVEFIVYVHPSEMKLKENSHVRQILLGEEKAKL